MKDMLRTLFSIRKPRKTPPTGPAPAVGMFIVRRDVRMGVTQPVPDDLWHWMVLSGWRAVPVKNDRRQYNDLPANALGQLIEAAPTERDRVHTRLLGQVQKNQ